MSHYYRFSFRASTDDIKKKSSIQMKENILNYLTKTVNRNKIKKIASLNDKKTEIIKDKKNENYYKELEKKTKAKRALLYLLNIKSKKTFCPEIIDLFKKIKKEKKKEKLLKKKKEENTKNNYLSNNNNNNKIKSPKIRSKFYPHKAAVNNLSSEKNAINEIKENLNDNNNTIKSKNELDFGKNSTDNILDNKNIKLINSEDIESDNNLKIKDLHISKNFVEELSSINKNNSETKKSCIKNKKRKKSNNKSVKIDKIDVIYNKQKNELQKFGNYHSSLRTAIQSTLSKTKIILKKK